MKVTVLGVLVALALGQGPPPPAAVDPQAVLEAEVKALRATVERQAQEIARLRARLQELETAPGQRSPARATSLPASSQPATQPTRQRQMGGLLVRLESCSATKVAYESGGGLAARRVTTDDKWLLLTATVKNTSAGTIHRKIALTEAMIRDDLGNCYRRRFAGGIPVGHDWKPDLKPGESNRAVIALELPLPQAKRLTWSFHLVAAEPRLDERIEFELAAPAQ